MNYENMTEHEINQAVTCEVFVCHQWSVNESGDFYHCGYDGSAYYEVKVIDYCNNPSDAWPIIMENKIAVMPWNIKEWRAFIMKDGEPTFRVRHSNPLRAAMIVFLKMQEAKRG